MPSRTGAKRVKHMGESMRVHPWPQNAADALLALESDAACVVISVATLRNENRTLARQSIREALQELLAAYWQHPVKSIQFSSRIGEAVALLSPASTVGLSISHAPGCSLAAVHLHCTVGVDVVRIDTDRVGGDDALPDWDQLAQDYLGPVAHQQLVHTAPGVRAAAFARAWSQLEAGLKCQGQGLTEWTPALGQALASCTTTILDLPDTLRGTLAVGPPRHGPASTKQAYKPSINFRF